MMGRLKPILNALDREDHLRYRSHYCGICVSTKRVHGCRASLGHSSEMVFVSLLLEGLSPETFHTERGGCTILPFLPKSLSVGDGKTRTAIAAGLLAALKLDLEDAREDRERRIKQLLCRSLDRVRGAIDPARAMGRAFVEDALRGLPRDEVARVVAGVVGSVFHLAGAPPDAVTTGCRIGHVMGRLMNLSDAAEDFFADRRAGRSNPLGGRGGVALADEVERGLLGLLDELDELVACLPLKRNLDLVEKLVNVHARARASKTVSEFRERLAAVAAPGAPATGESADSKNVPVSVTG